MVVGRDVDACEALIGRYAGSAGDVEFKPVTRPKRFGSLLRRYVGDRVGRVHLRPGWAASDPPPLAEGTRCSTGGTRRAADFEAQAWNDAKALAREPVGDANPPDTLLMLLRVIAGGNKASARNMV